MKFKRCMTAICSSALVLGLSFLLYPQSAATTDTKATPTATGTPSVTATNPPANETAPTKAPVATPAPTPTPEIEHHKLLTGDLSTPISGVADVVTSYITSYYANDY